MNMLVPILVAVILAVVVVIIGIIGIMVATNAGAAYEFVMRRFRCCRRVCCYCCTKKRSVRNGNAGKGHDDETEITFKKVRSIKPLEDPADPEMLLEPQQVEDIPGTALAQELSLRSELTRVNPAGVENPERISDGEKSNQSVQKSAMESVKDETTVTNPMSIPASSPVTASEKPPPSEPPKPPPSEPPTDAAQSYAAMAGKDPSPHNKRRSS